MNRLALTAIAASLTVAATGWIVLRWLDHVEDRILDTATGRWDD